MTYLYRKNGGQVVGVSVDPAAYAGVDATYFGTVTDPTTPDGQDLSIAKIWDGTSLRNATQAEIDNFTVAESVDQNLIDRQTAINWLQTNPVQRKILRAIVLAILDSINQLRTSPTTAFSAITPAQAYNAILDKINTGTVD